MKPYYSHAGIQIFHGDCREVLPEISTESIDTVFTDPPYGMIVPSDQAGRFAGANQRGPHRADHIAGDTPEIAAHILAQSTQQVARIMKPDRSAFFFGRWSECHRDKPLFAQHLTVKSCIVWVKNRLGIGYYTRPQHEFIWYCHKGTPTVPKRALSDVIEWPHDALNQLHPHQKPEALIAFLLNWVGGESVLDPFCGSGSTLVAAKNSNRRAIGIEIEERWCEVAAQRLSQEVFKFA